MARFLMILTYIAYTFIVAMYTVKAVQWLKLPVHLAGPVSGHPREELPVRGSYYEEAEWWTKPRPRNFWRSLMYS